MFSLLAALLVYPAAPTAPTLHTYHGVTVDDRYSPLEDGQAETTQRWIASQNRLTSETLDALPGREEIRNRLLALWDFERVSQFMKRGKRYFFFKNKGLQNQSALYTVSKKKGKPKLLIDPNLLSEKGLLSLQGTFPSPDGAIVAYALSLAGSDETTVRLIRTQTGETLHEELLHTKLPSLAWLPDGSAFYYTGFIAEDVSSSQNQKIYLHRLGTSQQEDILVFETKENPKCLYHLAVSQDGSFLVISAHLGATSQNSIFIQPIGKGPVEPLFPDFDAEYDFVEGHGSLLYFKTTLNAPNGRLISVHVKKGKTIREVIGEKKEILKEVSLFGRRFVAHYLSDAKSKVEIYHMKGKPLQTLPLPIGTASSFEGSRGEDEFFFTFSSYDAPGTVYRYQLKKETLEPLFTPQVSLPALEISQHFYKSKDGTSVPLFLIRKKGASAPAPTLLYGYGGFSIPVTPSYSPLALSWIELGGVFAVANLRGGGEYGQIWHEQGSKKNKQNVFDDFIAAAEFLVEQKITPPKQLAITGASNGGLLVAACLNQRPDLFGAAIPQVGVMDMLRFPEFTVGWAWIPEYGSPDDPELFPILKSYSPLHNIKKGAYPPTLILTADHDDRVVPAHSFKYAAALQEAQTGEAPILLRVETAAGHGAGKPLTLLIDEMTDKLSFLKAYLVQ
jgi:prolyl oligopeptidase